MIPLMLLDETIERSIALRIDEFAVVDKNWLQLNRVLQEKLFFSSLLDVAMEVIKKLRARLIFDASTDYWKYIIHLVYLL